MTQETQEARTKDAGFLRVFPRERRYAELGYPKNYLGVTFWAHGPLAL
jgi:hypothetical protein